jgi:GDP-L-fucose synthase
MKETRMTFWTDKKVIVTGGAGFLGSFVVKKLKDRGCRHVFVPRSADYDLRDRDAILRIYREVRSQMVIHLAGVVGGNGANRAEPGRFFYDNALMGLQLMEYGRQFDVKKFVAVGAICAYPKLTPLPFKEENLWNGYPEEINAPYGLAKKMMLVQAQAYRAQYGFNAIYLLPVDLYGPGDNFDLETCHVIPAIIRKCIEAKEAGLRGIVLSGDGSTTREFLYVEDAAEGLLLAAERYNGHQPVNLGSAEEITIHDLALMIADQVGFTGEIVWDKSGSNGQPRRRLDVSKAAKLFGFRAIYPLRHGIAKTISWYQSERQPRLESYRPNALA